MDKEKLNDIVCESSSDYAVLNDAYNYIEDLEQQCKQQKEIINKTKRFLKDEGQKQYNIHDNYRGKWYSPDELDILNKILEDKLEDKEV